MQIPTSQTDKSFDLRLQPSQIRQRQGGKRRTAYPTRSRGKRVHRRWDFLNPVGLVASVLVSMGITLQVKAMMSPAILPEPEIQAGRTESLLSRHHQPNGLSLAELQVQAARLFATPNSIGTIAIGVAEGTRTPAGQRTSLWEHHIDPGNGAVNRGTFSWQLEVATPEEGDLKGLAYVQHEAIPHLIQAAERENLGLELETLIQGADLWIQSPEAGVNFVKNLKLCLNETQTMDEAVLCARVASFYDPKTGELDASGFDHDLDRVEADQRRRMQAIKTVLELNRSS